MAFSQYVWTKITVGSADEVDEIEERPREAGRRRILRYPYMHQVADTSQMRGVTNTRNLSEPRRLAFWLHSSLIIAANNGCGEKPQMGDRSCDREFFSGRQVTILRRL
jgi:hypothetical protein